MLADLPIPETFGVNVHFIDENLPQNMAYLKKSGIGWIRQDLFWDMVERRAGEYDFSAFDRLVDAAQEARIRIMFILDYSNSLYDQGTSPISPEARAAFARFSATAAKRYADKEVVWEIYNEPNWSFWKPEPNVDQYIALADEVTAAIRKAVPRALVVGPALSGPSRDFFGFSASETFLAKVLKSKAAHDWSAITIHPYRKKDIPETVAPILQHIRQMMRENGLNPEKTPVLEGELGYSTWLGGVDESTQAAFAVRELLWSTVEHMPLAIWYDWQDDGPNNLNKEYRFGLLRAGNPSEEDDADIEKPAFVAVAQMAGLLRGYRFAKAIESNSGYQFLAFTRGSDQAFALWSETTAQDVGVSLPEGEWVVTPLLGASYDLAATKGQTVVMSLDKMPVIVKKAE